MLSFLNHGSESEISSTKEDIQEIKHLVEIAKRPKVHSFLNIELRRFETKLVELLEKQEKEKNAANDSSEQKPPQTSPPKSYDVPYKNYSWDQSDKFVKFYLTNLKNVQSLPYPDGFVNSFTTRSAMLRICNLAGKNHVFEIKQLACDVDAAKSYYKVKTDMVVIFLAKAIAGQKWSHVSAAEKAKADSKAVPAPKMDDDDGDPSKGLMNMMKKMYDDGDDDMKRTIAKAWTESQNKGPGGGMGGLGGGMGGLGGGMGGLGGGMGGLDDDLGL